MLYVGPPPPANRRVLETFAQHARAIAVRRPDDGRGHAQCERVGSRPSTRPRLAAVGELPNGTTCSLTTRHVYHAGSATDEDLPTVGLALCVNLIALFEEQPRLLRLGAALTACGPTERVLAAFAVVLPSEVMATRVR